MPNHLGPQVRPPSVGPSLNGMGLEEIVAMVTARFQQYGTLKGDKGDTGESGEGVGLVDGGTPVSFEEE